MSDNVEYVLVTVLFSDGCAFNIPRLRLLPFCSPAEIHTRVQMTNKDFTGGVILHYDGSEVAEEFIKAGSYRSVIQRNIVANLIAKSAVGQT